MNHIAWKHCLFSVFTAAAMLWLEAYGATPTAWFGQRQGCNGLVIVPQSVNWKNITVSSNVTPLVAAHLLYDAEGWFDVTSTAHWSGTCTVVQRGPHRGTILGHQAGTGFVACAFMSFSNAVPLKVISPNDADNDGMLDAWELAHGFATNTNDAAGDANTNGISNLDEFLNGTDPNEYCEPCAFAPLLRYPYSNGFYCGPDVPLEWFASTTLGRYELEAAVWPGCDKLVYRADVWDTNAIGDPVVHTADLSQGMGAQCAFRVRAASTNASGWTAWTAWRPFEVRIPLQDHTLRLANGEPFRPCYFFFWNWYNEFETELAAMTGQFHYSFTAATNYLHVKLALTNDFADLNWSTNDALCARDLSFLRNALSFNSIIGSGCPEVLFVSAISHFSGEIDNIYTDYYIYTYSYWPTDLDREYCHTAGNQLMHMPLLSDAGHFGIALTHCHTTNQLQLQVYDYLAMRYLGIPVETAGFLEGTSVYRYDEMSPESVTNHIYGSGILADITNTNYQKLWVEYVTDFVQRYYLTTNTALNALLRTEQSAPQAVVCAVIELQPYKIRDAGPAACNAFRGWLCARYGTIARLNAAWDTEFGTWTEIDPMAQHGTVFRWTDREWEASRPQKLVRACDDFDEFTIERYAGGWHTIRRMLSARMPVVLAVEFINAVWSPDGPVEPVLSKAPLHRIGDFADAIVQRRGAQGDYQRQLLAYDEWRASGRRVTYAAMAAGRDWESYQTAARRGLVSAANAGVYSWNELNPVDIYASMAKNWLATNATLRYLRWMDQQTNSLLLNGGFEAGAAGHVPGWHADAGTARSLSCSFSGTAALEVPSGIHSISSDPVECSPDVTYALLWHARLDGGMGGAAAEIRMRLGTTDPRYVYHDEEGWYSEGQASVLAEGAESTPAVISDVKQWSPLLELYEGQLSGPTRVQFEFSVPEGMVLYIDDVSFLPLP